MKVFIQGKTSTTLTKREFLAAGGQGSVYAKGTLAYKVYDDPTKMIPVAKIGELHAITEPKVIKPEDVLLDEMGKPIGYTMRFVKDTFTLCQTFTKAFRQRSGLTPEKALGLVRDLQATVKDVHSRGVLIVDLNEMNFLVDQALSEVYAIDVDSWQTRSFHAAALMESVRDRHSPKNHFSELTDWFAFAIVSFQMFIGIHPYKGRHPQYGDDMEQRMLHNLSVLNPEVKYPAAVVQPLTVIPEVYQRWYEAVLERGERVAPPWDLVARIAAVVTAPMQTQVGGAISVTKLFELPEDLVGYFDSPTNSVVLTTYGAYVGDRFVSEINRPVSFGFAPKMERPVAACVDGGKISLFDLLGKRVLPIDLLASGVMGYQGRIYAASGTSLVEITFLETGTSIIPCPNVVGSCLELATKVYDGVIIQDLLGSYYASFFPKSGVHYQVRLEQLDGYRIVEAKHSAGVLMVVATRKGKYDRFVFKFDEFYAHRDMTCYPDVTPTGLNFVVLPSGVCVQIDEGGDVRVFSSRPGSSREKVIGDSGIEDMRLAVKGASLIGLRGKEAFTLRMK